MKSNSKSKTAALALLAAITVILASWPTTGYSQSSSRRDRERFRRDYSVAQDTTRSGSVRPDASGRPGAKSSKQDAASKTEAARPGVPPQGGRITGAAEPNSPAKAVERRRSRSLERSSNSRPLQDEQWDKYKIILTRNMFSRDRRPARRGDDTPPPPIIMPNPESYFLLRGVIQEDGQFMAFVEDKNTGAVLRLRQGDHVARGEIKSLTLDSIEYQFQDKTITVNMGYDLEGGRGAVTASDLASYTPMSMTTAPATSTTTAGQSATPSADEAEILKRLMEQRKQQLGQ
jgi:hypothetical protein